MQFSGSPVLPSALRRGLASLLVVSLSGCATLMTERTQTIRLTTQPPGRTVYFQERPVRDGASLTVHRDFEAPAFEIREGGRRVPVEMEYKAEPWIIGDAILLIPFIIPGLVAGGLDIGTGAWRKLNDPQTLDIEAVLAANRLEAPAPARTSPARSSEVETPAADPPVQAQPAKTAPKPAPPPSTPKAAAPESSTTAPALPPPEEGIVSWYNHSDAGHKTASGARFDPESMTAAHRTLPFGAVVRVTRLDTNYSVVVTINDRGPFVAGRIIDLTPRPAEKLGLPAVGIAPCRVEVLELPGR